MNSLILFIAVGASLLVVITMGVKTFPKREPQTEKAYPSLLNICPDVRERARIWGNLLKANQMEEIVKRVADFSTAKSFRIEEDIPVNRIFAEPWEPDRLAGAIDGLVKKDTAPRIKVIRYLLHGDPWYVVDDGNHRASAARLMGRDKIHAYVTGELTCIPESHYSNPDNNKLWRVLPYKDGNTRHELKGHVSDTNMLNALIDIGVQVTSNTP